MESDLIHTQNPFPYIGNISKFHFLWYNTESHFLPPPFFLDLFIDVFYVYWCLPQRSGGYLPHLVPSDSLLTFSGNLIDTSKVMPFQIPRHSLITTTKAGLHNTIELLCNFSLFPYGVASYRTILQNINLGKVKIRTLLLLYGAIMLTQLPL